MDSKTSQFEDDNKRLFSCWAGGYDSAVFRLYFERLYRRMMVLLRREGHSYLTPGSSALDVACGTGEVIWRLAQQYPQVTFIGLDLTPAMVEKASQKVQSLPNVEIREGRADDLVFPDGTFDLVLCSEAFHHFAFPEKSLQEIYRVAKSPGLFLLVDPGFASSLVTRIVELVSRTFETNKHIYTQS